jgi:hypothetical protein
MKKPKPEKEPRWYLLWYATAAMWCITFLGNLLGGSGPYLGWIMVVQFLNIWVNLGAGIVNARRYRKKHGPGEEK